METERVPVERLQAAATLTVEQKTKKTDCPRVDEFQNALAEPSNGGDRKDWATFARQLERGLAAAKQRAEAAERERDAAVSWNHRVSVCANHTSDIVDGECIVCERDALREDAERYRWPNAETPPPSEPEHKAAAATMTVEMLELIQSDWGKAFGVNGDVIDELCALARDGLKYREAIARGPVAYGVRNTAITGRPLRMMSVRLEVPSDDQYGGQLWTPLYALDD